LMKLPQQSETGDGWGMVPGLPNNGFWNPTSFFPSQNFRKFVFFSVCQLQGFFW
jgi:hypothetical protein